MIGKLKNSSKKRLLPVNRGNEVRSWISFRSKDDPIRSVLKRQQAKIIKKLKGSSPTFKPDIEVDVKKKVGSTIEYDAYNDPYLLRFFSKAGTIKQMMRTGMVIWIFLINCRLMNYRMN